MRIISVEPFSGEYIDVEGSGWHPYHEFRRTSAENWEVSMGESWESVYDCDDLEAAYQAWKVKAG